MKKTATAQRHADYRRGTVLGLTIAEIFILLLFLLLLMLLATIRDQEADDTELANLRSELAEAEERLDDWRGVMEEFEAPEDVVTLRAQRDAAERRSEDYRQRAEALREIVNEYEAGGDALAKLADEAQQAREAMHEAQRELDENQRQFDLWRRKGEDPPCWYETVEDARRGGTREKPLYALNVGVFDSYMIFRPRPPPAGGATDDGDAMYAEEAARLNLDDMPYDEPLDDEAVVRHLQPLYEAGENEEVRSYACKFWLYVWDMTSPDAKERWKRAHDQILEGMFGSYTVQDEPWLGGGGASALSSTESATPSSIDEIQ